MGTYIFPQTSGNVSALGKFIKNGANVFVTEDTVTPANNIPLPVKIESTSGEVTINAGDLDVNINATGANYSSVRIGDGTNELDITALNEAKVSVTTSVLPSDAATETTLALIKNTDGIKKITDTVTVSGDVKSNSANIATETTMALIKDTDGIKKIVDTVTVSGNVTSNSANIATENTLALIKNTDGIKKITDTVTVSGDVKSNSANIATETTLALIKDTDGIKKIVDTVTVSGTVTANVGTLDVKEFASNNCGSANITTAAYVQLIASTAAATKKIQVLDTSGSFFYIATGAALSEANKFITGPGSDQTIEITIPAGTRISAKAVDANATAGYLAINLLG